MMEQVVDYVNLIRQDEIALLQQHFRCLPLLMVTLFGLAGWYVNTYFPEMLWGPEREDEEEYSEEETSGDDVSEEEYDMVTEEYIAALKEDQ